MMTRTIKITLGIVLLLTLIVASGSFYILEEGMQGVVVQFGKPVGSTVSEAGLHVKLPFIQRILRFEKRLLIWDGDPNQIPTAGREFIWVDATARWRIVDPLKFLESVSTENGAQSRLDDIVDSVIRDLVSASPLVELVRSTTWQPSESDIEGETPQELAEELMRDIQLGRERMTRAILEEVRIMTPQYGIEVVDVRIKHLNYVQSVREKVYDRMISERNRIASRYRSEGEGRSAEILGNMEKELREIRSTAYRRVQEIRGDADASATRIYGEAYGRDPEFYAFSRTLEEYKEKQNDSIMLVLTTDSDFYQYLKAASPPPE
jgi:membrane protease subunit HflC